MSNVSAPNNSGSRAHTTAGVCGRRIISPMPKHMRLDEWPFPYPLSTLFQCIFTGFCILTYGHTTLESVWIALLEDGETWNRNKMLMITRFSQNNVIGGLLLASIAGWLTSSPPAGKMLDYTTRGPYVCLLASFGLLCGSIIVGSAMLYALPLATATWFRMTLMGNRFSVCNTMLLLTYPFLSLAVGASTAIVGFLLAAFNSQDRLIQVGWISLVLLPASFILFFFWNQVYHLLVFTQRHKGQELADET